MTRQVDAISLAKAVLWEEAKGKLRAMVAADGAQTTPALSGADDYPFQKIERVVESFIKTIEDNGLHE